MDVPRLCAGPHTHPQAEHAIAWQRHGSGHWCSEARQQAVALAVRSVVWRLVVSLSEALQGPLSAAGWHRTRTPGEQTTGEGVAPSVWLSVRAKPLCAVFTYLLALEWCRVARSGRNADHGIIARRRSLRPGVSGCCAILSPHCHPCNEHHACATCFIRPMAKSRTDSGTGTEVHARTQVSVIRALHIELRNDNCRRQNAALKNAHRIAIMCAVKQQPVRLRSVLKPVGFDAATDAEYVLYITAVQTLSADIQIDVLASL